MPRTTTDDEQGVLEERGAFRVAVAPGWDATAIPGRRYDLRHRELDAVVTISIARGDLPSAAAMARAFATRTGAGPDLAPAERSTPQGVRAFVRFEASGGAWAAMVLRHDDVAVLASTRAPADDHAAREAGEAVVGSLAPSGRGRRGRR